MSERRIDDVRIGNSEYEFAHRNAWEGSGFAQKPVVRCALQFEKRIQTIGVVGQSRQDSFVAIDVLGWNQPVCIVAGNFGDAWQAYRPPRRASSNCRTLSIAGWPPLIMYANGISPPNMGFSLGSCTQRSASFLL